jgi:hypothetical protein
VLSSPPFRASCFVRSIDEVVETTGISDSIFALFEPILLLFLSVKK